MGSNPPCPLPPPKKKMGRRTMDKEEEETCMHKKCVVSLEAFQISSLFAVVTSSFFVLANFCGGFLPASVADASLRIVKAVLVGLRILRFGRTSVCVSGGGAKKNLLRRCLTRLIHDVLSRLV